MWGICGDFTRNCGIEKFQNCVPDCSPSFSIPALGKRICWLVLPVPGVYRTRYSLSVERSDGRTVTRRVIHCSTTTRGGGRSSQSHGGKHTQE